MLMEFGERTKLKDVVDRTSVGQKSTVKGVSNGDTTRKQQRQGHSLGRKY